MCIIADVLVDARVSSWGTLNDMLFSAGNPIDDDDDNNDDDNDDDDDNREQNKW